MGTESMRERFGSVLSDLLDEDPRVAVVLADIGVGRLAETGALRRHRERVVNVGIREQLMIGVAAGMALDGRRPFVHSYTPFLVERPFESLKLDLSHQGVGAVLVSTGASYDASTAGRTHQAPEDVALVAALPDWEIHVPGHADELEAVMRHSAGHDRPVYIRMSSLSNTSSQPVVPGEIHAVRIGSEATVIAVGPMLDPVVHATRDRDVTILYAATVRPFDGAGLRRNLAGSNVVLVEPYLAGTSAYELTSAVDDRPIRLLALGVTQTELRRYGHPKEHAAAHGLDAAGLRRSIDRFLDGAPRGQLSSARCGTQLL